MDPRYLASRLRQGQRKAPDSLSEGKIVSYLGYPPIWYLRPITAVTILVYGGSDKPSLPPPQKALGPMQHLANLSGQPVEREGLFQEGNLSM
jgi:hypothetical protein